jgi:hypothetical protein
MDAAYVTGFYVGVFAFFLVLVGIWWLSGRLGWFGGVIRFVVVGLAILKVVSLLTTPLPS